MVFSLGLVYVCDSRARFSLLRFEEHVLLSELGLKRVKLRAERAEQRDAAVQLSVSEAQVSVLVGEGGVGRFPFLFQPLL